MASRTENIVKKAIEGSKKRNFSESVELAINIRDVDLSIPKNRINEEILLPHGRGKDIRIAVIGSAELAMKAQGVADRVIQPEELEELAGDKKASKKLVNDYTFFVAEAPLMPLIGKRLGVVMGPRGKMPKPVPPGADPSSIINNLKRSITVRSKANRTFHAVVGTKDMDVKMVAENVDAVMKRVLGKLERGQMNIASAYVKTTMGPAIKLM